MAISDLPTNVFTWATDTLDNTGLPTKVEPDVEFKQTGILKQQPWPRLWLNYAFYNHGAYLEHLINEPIGTVKIMTTGTITDATDQWGGIWSKTTDTLGGISVDVFEKTSL